MALFLSFYCFFLQKKVFASLNVFSLAMLHTFPFFPFSFSVRILCASHHSIFFLSSRSNEKEEFLGEGTILHPFIVMRYTLMALFVLYYLLKTLKTLTRPMRSYIIILLHRSLNNMYNPDFPYTSLPNTDLQTIQCLVVFNF